MVDNPECNQLEVVQVAVNLYSFKKANVFQSSVIAFMSGLFHNQNEIQKLGKMFEHMDMNNDGFIELKELEHCMNHFDGDIARVLGTAKNWKEIFDALDTNGDGKLDYNEFLQAAANRIELLNDQNLQRAFSALDQNGDGKVSAEELKETFAAGVFNSGKGSIDDALWL